jgi:hypothetical protein
MVKGLKRYIPFSTLVCQDLQVHFLSISYLCMRNGPTITWFHYSNSILTYLFHFDYPTKILYALPISPTHAPQRIVRATLEEFKYSSFAGRHSVRRETRIIPTSIFCLPSNRFRPLGFSEEAMFQEQRTDHKPSPSLPQYLQNSSKTSTENDEMQFGDKEQRLVGPTGGGLSCSECSKFVHTRITTISPLSALRCPFSFFKLSATFIYVRPKTICTITVASRFPVN